METKDIELWKIITHDRKSCFISQLSYGMGDFVITYPVDKWVRPPKGSKIFAFNDKVIAKRWLYYIFTKKYAENCCIVPAVGRYPYSISMIIYNDFSDIKLSSFWVNHDYNPENPYVNNYNYDKTPNGTVCVAMLKCLE